MTHDIEQNAPALSPTRRTVLTGAAWTLPVIAAATITPMAAASNAPTLAFDKSTYNSTACGTITGAYVTVTVNSVPTAGKSVTTSLSGGYKFSDGTTTNTQVSGSNGRVNLPAINVPSAGGTSPTTATTETVTASATIKGAANSTAKTWYSSASGSSSYNNVPRGSTPVGWLTFLAPNGDLYYNNSRLAQNVSSAVADHSEPGSGFQRDFITFVSGGVAKTWYSSASGSSGYNNVPAGSTAVGWLTFLAPNGDLYYNNSRLAQNVSSAVAEHEESGSGFQRDFLTFVSDGVAKAWYSGSSTIDSKPNVPTDSTAVGCRTYLAPNGDLYYQNDRLAQNVSSAVAEHQEPGSGFQRDHLTFVSDGVAKAWYSGSSTIDSKPNVPTDSTAVGCRTYLAPNGDLYYQNDRLAQNVSGAKAQHQEPGSGFQRDFVTYSQYSSC